MGSYPSTKRTGRWQNTSQIHTLNRATKYILLKKRRGKYRHAFAEEPWLASLWSIPLLHMTHIVCPPDSYEDNLTNESSLAGCWWLMPVNPSYLGGRDQEDCGSKPGQANNLKTLSWKALYKNRAGGVAQGKGPEFKFQYHQKKKRERRQSQTW
jgi:hypothetical protein